jgi:hypothetical protein
MQRGLHQSFRFAVERGSGLIQNQDGRVLSSSARAIARPLALASGKPHPALSNDSIVPCGKAHNKIMGQRCSDRGLDFFLRNLRLAVGDVVADGIVEQDRVLGDDADLKTQGRESYVAHVVGRR